MKHLFDDQRTDGASTAGEFYGGQAWLIVAGNLGGGTITAQMQAPDGRWVNLADSAVTSAGAQVLDAPRAPIRLQLQGAASASVSAWLV